MGSKNIPGEPREQLAPASVRQVCGEPGASRLGLRWRAGPLGGKYSVKKRSC